MTARFKVCMLGDFGVGKTSLVRRHVEGVFDPTYHTTLGVNVYKHVEEPAAQGAGAERVEQLLWDIEGGLQREALLDSYLRGASGAVVVGDVTREDAVATMRENAERFRRARPGRPVVFALNKIDLVGGAATVEGGAELAAEFGGSLEYTSAATGEAVAQLFRTLAARMLTVGG
jgi:GTPase SAR1 family protein